MAKLVYNGPFDAVTVPMPGGGEQDVEHGGVLNTTDAHAASLLEQVANWAPFVAPTVAPKVEKVEPKPESNDLPKDTD